MLTGSRQKPARAHSPLPSGPIASPDGRRLVSPDGRQLVFPSTERAPGPGRYKREGQTQPGRWGHGRTSARRSSLSSRGGPQSKPRVMWVSPLWAHVGAGPHARLLGVSLPSSSALPTQNSGAVPSLPVPASRPRAGCGGSVSATRCFLVASSVCLSVCLSACVPAL